MFIYGENQITQASDYCFRSILIRYKHILKCVTYANKPLTYSLFTYQNTKQKKKHNFIKVVQKIY